jgi:hypothetical protein
MDSEDNIRLHLQELFASYGGQMTEQQIAQEAVDPAVQAAVFYKDVRKDGETYHWVTL